MRYAKLIKWRRKISDSVVQLRCYLKFINAFKYCFHLLALGVYVWQRAVQTQTRVTPDLTKNIPTHIKHA